MYVDYLYYFNEYGGRMPEEAFPSAARKSEAYIRYLTFINGEVFEVESIPVKNAVCAAADVFYAADAAQAARQAVGMQGPVKSENNDGHSVTYVSEQLDGQTVEEATKQKAYDAAYPYLLPTGWLSRRVRCGHDHQCRYHGL